MSGIIKNLTNKANTEIIYPITVAEAVILNESTTLVDALDSKVDKALGKQLSQENYTTLEKSKLYSIQSGAQVNPYTFSTIKVSGSGDVVANQQQGPLTFIAGPNIVLGTSPTTKAVTISATGTVAIAASNTSIVDTSEYYTSMEVEGALQEIGDDIQALNEQISTVSGELDVHKAESASQDNVHGLRGANVILGVGSTKATGAISDNVVVIGNSASIISTGFTNTDSSGAVVIGYNARAEDSTTNSKGMVAVGQDAKVTGGSGTAVGSNSNSGSYSVALGRSATTSGNYSVAIGLNANAINTNEGILGNNSSVNKWIVPGNFTVNGTKNFEIPHPKPEKRATHRIRHGVVESPTAGDTLYRYKIQSTKENDLQYIDLPDYFIYLNKDVQIFVTGQGHFGNGYGELNKETEQLEIHCQFEGEYNILVIGTRNDDHQSVKDWDIKGVEREIGESWTGETYVFSVDEIMEIEEIKEESA